VFATEIRNAKHIHTQCCVKSQTKRSKSFRFRVPLHQLYIFLKDPLPVPHIVAMDRIYKLSTITNSEIHFRWLRLGLKAKWEGAIDPAVSMAAMEQGRMKFTRPLFRYSCVNMFYDVTIVAVCFYDVIHEQGPGVVGGESSKSDRGVSGESVMHALYHCAASQEGPEDLTCLFN